MFTSERENGRFIYEIIHREEKFMKKLSNLHGTCIFFHFTEQIILFFGCYALYAANPVPNEAGPWLCSCRSRSSAGIQLNRTINFLKYQTLRAANTTSIVAAQYVSSFRNEIIAFIYKFVTAFNI